MDLGTLISQKRKQAGLTIDELSMRSGVPKGTLNKILNGITRDPQLETVKALARALGCTLEDFDDTPRPRTLTQPEFDLIQKYRRLDNNSRRLVDLVIDRNCAADRPPIDFVYTNIKSSASLFLFSKNNAAKAKTVQTFWSARFFSGLAAAGGWLSPGLGPAGAGPSDGSRPEI